MMLKEGIAPKVSVVIPCFNLGQYLDDAVQSVLNQTMQNFDIIIADPSSTDPFTVNLLADYKRPKTRVIKMPRVSLSESRNRIIKGLQSPYICCLDADDILEPECFAQCVGVLDGHPDVGFVTFWFKLFGTKVGEVRPFGVELKDFLVQNSASVASLFRMEAWQKAGGYDENSIGYEDWDLWLKILESGYKAFLVEDFLMRYRVRPDSMLHTSDRPEMRDKIMDRMFLKHEESFKKHAMYVIREKDKLLGRYRSYWEIAMSKSNRIEKHHVAAHKYIDELKTECAKLKGTNEEMRHRVVGLESSLSQKQKDILEKEQAILDREDELRSIYYSKAWRMGAALKNARQSFKGLCVLPFKLASIISNRGEKPALASAIAVECLSGYAGGTITYPLNIGIGNIVVLGYSFKYPLLTLYFAVRKRVRDNYVIFTHLYPDTSSALPGHRKEHGFLNFDHAPLGGTRRWRPGRLYKDDIFLGSVPRAKYSIQFGFLEPASLRRIKIQGQRGDAVEIKPVDMDKDSSVKLANTSPSKFSIIVCTHNRVEYLKKAVESLFALDYPRDSYEIIVVDNRSVDGTRDTVAELAKRSPVSFSYFFEPRLGLSHARNTGIRHSKFDLIAYLDDDAAADAGWLTAFDETFRKFGADVVGGKVVPMPIEGFIPEPWFYTPYVWGFYGLDYGKRGREEKIIMIQHPDYIGGGNSCYRKELLSLPWAKFHGRLGRTGKKLYQGEETLLNFFLTKNGYKIFYNAEVVIYHFVDPERLNKRYVMRKAFWGGYSDTLMHRKMFGLGFVLGNGPRQLANSFRAYKEAKGSKLTVDDIFEKKGLLLHDLGYMARLLRFWEMMRSG